MRKLIVFNNTTLDGYFTDKNNDMSWAHTSDPEWDAFTAENAKGKAEFLFGRITYEMMASFWPTPFAMENYPDVAKGMNDNPKIVFSKTLDKAEWQNSKLVKGNLTDEVKKLKEGSGSDILIFGSGAIVSQLTDAGLIDEYQIVIHPLVLGSGRTMFDGVKEKVKLKRIKERGFKNGNILLYYQLVK
jgi:dihydrofolate reductase